jgi:zinc and cadmium transporter
MVTSYPLISWIGRPALGSLLSLSAGALVYVGATHLIPHTEHEPRRYSLIALTTGVLAAIGIILGHTA